MKNSFTLQYFGSSSLVVLSCIVVTLFLGSCKKEKDPAPTLIQSCKLFKITYFPPSFDTGNRPDLLFLKHDTTGKLLKVFYGIEGTESLSVTYEYNQEGQVASQTLNNTYAPTSPEVYTYSYNAKGQRDLPIFNMGTERRALVSMTHKATELSILLPTV